MLLFRRSLSIFVQQQITKQCRMWHLESYIISPWKMAAILADDIFEWISLNENCRIVPMSPINNKPTTS